MREGMIEVSKETFHATVGQMNVHPRAEREASYYETPYRELKGITTPGYMGGKPGESRRYYILEELRP